ncbi:MAG: trimethylamine methyltransferase family protein [Syntrophomonadaceae bacterium]
MGRRDRRRRIRRGRCRGGHARPLPRRALLTVRPHLKLLEPALLDRILEEAFVLLDRPGVRVAGAEARRLLEAAGASVSDGVARIPGDVVRNALALAPREFFLHDRSGVARVRYGGDSVQFDPGSSCVHVLDGDTGRRREAVSEDLVRLVRLCEALPEYDAQSTALVCADVPKEIGDVYRLLLVLRHSDKPIVTGSFTADAVAPMVALLVADAGGETGLRRRPRAIFDVCPSAPLHWSEFACDGLVALARAGVPAEIVSVPLAGATAPATLAGAAALHAAETLAGIAIAQLAAAPAPVVWGGAPAIFDMRTGMAPMGAIETSMLDLACAEIGKHLGLPTHAYLGGSDAKLLDAQAGMESAQGLLLGALGGINMISGAGMLDFLACQSLEKLVVDAEAIASARRLLDGVSAPAGSLAVAMFAKTGLAGEFLKLPETRRLFRLEQHLPSAVVDRASLRAWEDSGSRDIAARARTRVRELLSVDRRGGPDPERERARLAVVAPLAARAGLDGLPAA